MSAIQEELRKAKSNRVIEHTTQKVNFLSQIEQSLNEGRPVGDVSTFVNSEINSTVPIQQFKPQGALPPELSLFDYNDDYNVGHQSSSSGLNESKERDFPIKSYSTSQSNYTKPQHSAPSIDPSELRMMIRNIVREEIQPIISDLINKDLADKFAKSMVVSVIKEITSKNKK